MSAVQSSTASISGVVSGLDTDSILAKLRAVEQTAVSRLQHQQSAVSAKLSAWQAFNTKLLALKTAASGLALANTFRTRALSVSSDAVTATVTGTPEVGQTSFTVLALAQAHQLATQGYADADTTLVGEGSLTLNGQEIATTGLTLNGLRDAINAAGAGVHASVVNTGAAGTPYRLLLTSDTTGAAGAITATVNVTGTPPAFTTTQEAQDAHLQFGRGAGALDVYRASNTITDVISGVTLNLTRESTTPVTVKVTSDTAAIAEKVNAAVTAYNDVMKFINEQSKFDSATKTSPALFGDFRLMQVQDDLDTAFFSPVSGVDAGLSLLSQVGVTRGADGLLTLDKAKLGEVFEKNTNGVLRLFAAYAEGPAGITYVGSTAATKPSGADGYVVEITRAAAQARVTAGMALSGTLAAAETLTLNGQSIALAAGLDHAGILAAINALSSRTGVRASFTGADGTGAGDYLSLIRTGYGALSISAVSDLSSAGAATSGLGNLLVTQAAPGGESGSGTGAAGADVAGTIDGVAATGSGARLTATTGDAAGLSLLVSCGVGVAGPVVFTRGLAAALSDTLISITEEKNGAYLSATEGLQSRIDALGKDITATQQRVDEKMSVVTRQFQQMESALARLQSQSQYLTNQLAQLDKNSSGS